MGENETLDCAVKRDVEIIFHGWHFYPSDPDQTPIMNINFSDPRYFIYKEDYPKSIAFYSLLGQTIEVMYS